MQVLRQLKIFMTWRIKMFLLKKFELTKYHLLKRRTRTPVWQKNNLWCEKTKKTTWETRRPKQYETRKTQWLKRNKTQKNADCGFTGRFAKRFSGERSDPLGFELTFLSELKWVCYGGCLTAELCSALVYVKHPWECHLRFFVDILKLWVIVTLSLSNITSRTKAFTISFRTGISCISHKEPSSSNSISCRRQGTCNRAVSLAQYRSLVLLC